MTRAESKRPRGIRNHNPGNIRKSSTDWRGKVGDDGAFVTFDDPVNGIRAMARILLNYQKNYGLDTIRKLVNRWAPPNENDTTTYTNFVASRAGVSPDAKIIVHDMLPVLLPAFIQMENGMQPYDSATIKLAVDLAVKK
jgi:hypothetical protein